MLASELITSLNKAIAIGGDFEVNDYSPTEKVPIEVSKGILTVEDKKEWKTPIVTGTGPAVVKPEKIVVKQPSRRGKKK